MSCQTDSQFARRRDSRPRTKLKNRAKQMSIGSHGKSRLGELLALSCREVKMFNLISLLLIIASCCCACWLANAAGPQSPSEFNDDDAWPTIGRERGRAYDKISENQFAIGELLAQLHQLEADEPAQEKQMRNTESRSRRYSAQNYNDLQPANEPNARLVATGSSDKQIETERAGWKWRRRTARLQQQNKRPERRPAAVVEQPPSELTFSNQTGAVVLCGVAYELAQGLARADKQQRHFQEQRRQQRPGPPTGQSQQQIQIKWEKAETGEELEQIHYAGEITTGSGAFEAAGEFAKPDNRRPPILRYVRASDGALVFEPFRSLDFRPDVHATSYRCVASVLAAPARSHQAASGQQAAWASLVSRDMRVRAVVAQPAQSIQIEVMDELVQQANAAVFKCQVPAYAQSYLRLLDWTEYPSERTFSAQQSADAILKLPSNVSQYDERHFVHPKSGDLVVLRVGVQDNYRSYKCRCKNTLTGELVSSANRGKLIVSESHAPMAPKLSIYSNAASSLASSEFTQLATRTVTYEKDDWALLVCHLQAFPRASISWFKQHVGSAQHIGELLDSQPDHLEASLLTLQTQLLHESDNAALSHLLASANPSASQTAANKFVQLENLLFIRRLERNDSGAYVCVARNQVGEERSMSNIQVRSPLRAKLSVSANVIELGKSLSLECNIFGYPIQQVVFRHNQNVIKSISGAESLAQLQMQSLEQRQTSLAGEQQPQEQLRNYFVLDDDEDDAREEEQPGASEQRAGLESEFASSSTSAPANSSSSEPDESSDLSHVIVIVLEPKHAGAYQCFAHNNFESAQSGAFVRVLDDPPKFKQTFRSQLYQENQDISLMCAARANPIPEITWSLDDTPIAIDETNRVRFGDFVTKDNLVISYVNISSAQVADGGLYRCTADNRLAQVAHEAQVSVAGEPQVKPMANVTVLASSTFRKRCPVAGHPIGEVQWRHGGQRLPANHRQHVYENGTLEVEHMEKSAGDEGEYTCAVSGAAGAGSESQRRRPEASGSVHVSIRARPTIEPFAISRQLREGQRASIMCTISSGDLPIAISWLRNEQLLVPAGQLEHSTLMGGQHQRQDAPNSQLVVMLAAGKSGGQPHAAVFESASQPTSGEQQLLPGVRISRVSDYSSTLLFESLLSQHSANYTCLARNDAGSVSYQAPMIVQVAPKWAIEPTDTNIVRGSGATIDCMATGFPPPRIIWTRATGESSSAGISASQSGGSAKQESLSKQANELAGRSSSSHQLGSWRSIVSSPHLQVFENGSLNILDGRDSDFGHYMCQASNGVGPGLSKVIRVAINVAAHFETTHSIQLVARGEPARLRCRAKGDWPLQLAWFRNKQRLEPVNFQEARAELALHAPPPNPVPLSSTLASLLLLPIDLSLQQNLSANSPPTSQSSSLADQLSSLFAGTRSAERQYQSSELSATGGGQRKPTGPVGGGSLLARYSVQTSEWLIGGPSEAAPLQQVAQELRQIQQQNSLASMNQFSQSSREAYQQAHLVEINSLLTIQQTERADSATFRCLARNNFGSKETTIQLVVQEPPDRVDELSVIETSSRSITLAWLAPYHGNAPILSYHVQYRVATNGQAHSSPPGARSSPETVNSLNWFNYTIAASATSASNNAETSAQSTPVPPHQAHRALTSEQEAARLPTARALNKLTISSLRPVSQYWFRVEAENKLGRGPVSNIVETLTLEEAPGAAPNKVRASAQSSSSILVSWTRLNEKELFGSIQGYYVAYKPLIGAGQQQAENKTIEEANKQTAAATNLPSFKTVAHDDKLQKFDALLTGLKKSTRYMVSVQAFNIRGTGPSSEPVLVATLDLDPPRQVKLFVKQASNCSIELEWRPLSQAALALKNSASGGATSASLLNGEVEPRPDGDVVDYYSLYHTELNEEPRWQETRLPGHAASHPIEQLKCGTRYQFYMMGANKVRMGDQSEILDTKTAGGLPIAPDRQSTFDVLNTTCYVVRLDHWQDNGCPIQQFNIRQRLEPSHEWLQVAHFDFSVAASDKQTPISASSDRKSKSSIEEPSGVLRSNSKRSLDNNQDTLLDEASASDDLDSAFIDYSAGGDSGDELNMMSITDYMTLDSASSLVSKSSDFESQQADPYNLLQESVALIDANFEDEDSKKERPQHVSGRASVKMPQSAQEWQASNFVVAEEDGSKRKKDEQQLARQPDWRRVRLCNLAENAYYTVQIRAQNRVGETEAELRLLTSPEGLEYDDDIKRHVVSRLGGINGGTRTSAIPLNERLNGLMVLNQWPTLVPIMLTLTLVTIVVIIALLLKKPPSSHGGSPSSSSTTTTLTSKHNNGHFADHRPPPSSLGLSNGHSGTLYHQHQHVSKLANGAPSAITTADGTIDGGDLMLGAAAVDTYASVAATMPHHRQPFNQQHQTQHYGGSLCNQPTGDKEIQLDLQHGRDVDEITLADIYQKQGQAAGNNQQEEEASYQEDLSYAHAACGTGSLVTNLASTSASGTNTNFSAHSPSTTAPLSLNSANSMSSGHTMNGHQTLPLHSHEQHHQQHANPAEGLNVYLCAKEQHQAKQQHHNQEATIFYGLPPIDSLQAPYGQQVQMRRFQQNQHGFNNNLQMEHQQQCLRNGELCIHEHDRAALGFDPVYATIRRTFPQAFKYLTLQHHNHNHNHSQQSNQMGGANDQQLSQQQTVAAQEMAFFDSNAQ